MQTMEKFPVEKVTQDFSSSQPSPLYTSLRSTFASVSLHRTDRLRFLGFPPTIIDSMRRVIITNWPRGIQAERPYEGSTEFKLSGNPWTSNLAAEAMSARRMMTQILAALASQGWMLALSTDISRKSTDKDTLLFRHNGTIPAPMEWLTISFSKQDRLRFVDAPEDVIRTACTAFSRMTQNTGPLAERGVFELKFAGNPWRASGGETMDARKILLVLMELLEAHGFTVYGSIDQKATASENVGETDTWHVCRQVGWNPSMPVYHA